MLNHFNDRVGPNRNCKHLFTISNKSFFISVHYNKLEAEEQSIKLHYQTKIFYPNNIISLIRFWSRKCPVTTFSTKIPYRLALVHLSSNYTSTRLPQIEFLGLHSTDTDTVVHYNTNSTYDIDRFFSYICLLA